MQVERTQPRARVASESETDQHLEHHECLPRRSAASRAYIQAAAPRLVVNIWLRRMPQQPRRKRDNAPASKKKAGNTQAVPVPSQELPQPQVEEHKSHLYIALVIPILLLIASNSLVTFLYALALDPLYGSVPVHLHLEKVVWVATIAGAFGPVPPLRPSFAILGCLVALIPASSYWTALYTGRIGNPAIGSIATHLVVLFPVLYVGVSLVKRIMVWICDSSPVFLTCSQHLDGIRGPYIQ